MTENATWDCARAAKRKREAEADGSSDSGWEETLPAHDSGSGCAETPVHE
jgi:hypothetical protein